MKYGNCENKIKINLISSLPLSLSLSFPSSPLPLSVSVSLSSSALDYLVKVLQLLESNPSLEMNPMLLDEDVNYTVSGCGWDII